VVDLSYVTDMAGGNKEIVAEMIDIFIAQVPDFIKEMNSCFEKKDWYNLGMIAHKAKSSVAIMGMEDQAAALKNLEILAKDGKEQEKYKEIINNFEENCHVAIEELNQFKIKNA